MQGIATASSSPAAPYGAWAYLVVFALMALSFAGIPAIGATVVGWAAVLASQGKLNIFAVLIVAMLGAEAGGVVGYAIGDRWGRKFLGSGTTAAARPIGCSATSPAPARYPPEGDEPPARRGPAGMHDPRPDSAGKAPPWR